MNKIIYEICYKDICFSCYLEGSAEIRQRRRSATSEKRVDLELKIPRPVSHIVDYYSDIMNTLRIAGKTPLWSLEFHEFMKDQVGWDND